MNWSDSILKDKRILVTGASSGIGRSCAILCSKLGAQIIACGRNNERLSQTMGALSGEGHISLAFEMTDEQQIEEKLSDLKGSKPISGFIHCAGIERTNPLKTIYMDDFTEMFKINVASAVLISKLITKPEMYDKKGLSIVLISSIRGLLGEKGLIEYSSTKSAVFGLVKSLAKELASKSIRVNSIVPSMVNTTMLSSVLSTLPEESVLEIERKHLLGFMEPEDIANMCVYLISGLGKRVTGTNIVVDSGYSLS